jgi:hypothetical protein
VGRRLGALAGLLAGLLEETERDLADARAGRLFYGWDPRTGDAAAAARQAREGGALAAVRRPDAGGRAVPAAVRPGQGALPHARRAEHGPDVGPGARGDRGVEPAPGRGQEGGAGGRRLTPEARALPGPRPGR